MAEPGETIVGPDGQLRKWQPDTRNMELFNYLGPSSGFTSLEEAMNADKESGQGSWVPASEGGGMPWWMKAFVGVGFGSAAVTGLGAAFAPGLFGAGTGAGAGAAITGAGAPGYTTLPMVAPSVKGAGTLGTLGKLGAVSQILGGYQQGAAQGRQSEAQLNLGQDTLRQRQIESARQDALDRAKLDLDQRTTGQDLENQARWQAFQADYLKAGPYSVSRGEGGRYGPNVPVFEHRNEMADQAYRAAQQRLLSGSDKQFSTPPTIPTPALTPPPKSGWLDKLMQLGALGTGAAGAWGGYQPPKR
jgi:hypothetical protein